jgi:two-component system LytT family response regulator
MRAVIADDEALSRRLVRQLLERHRDVAIVAECADGAAALEAIESHRPDVIFLDIRMPLESGLEVARRRDHRTGPFIVYVTAFDRFAVTAYETDAVDYLTKPLTDERFDAALDRVRDRVHSRWLAARNVAAVERPDYVDHVVARVGNRDVIIPIETIDYIEADDVYAAVIAGARRHLVRTPLESLEGSLDPTIFARVHRSFIVRLGRIREVRWSGSAELVLDGGIVIPVSRRRRERLRALLEPKLHPGH